MYSDEELILENGELHRYAANINNGDLKLHTFQRKDDGIVDQPQTAQQTDIIVSSYSKEIIELILQSSLLLDEDAHQLSKIKLKLKVKNLSLKILDLTLFDAFLLTGLTAVVYFHFKSLIISAISGIIFPFIRHKYYNRNLRCALCALHKYISLSNNTLRRRVNLLHLHMTRLKTSRYDQDLPQALKEMSIIREKRFLHSVCQVTINILLLLINKTKYNIVKLMELGGNGNICSNNTLFIALKSDHDLGLTKFDNDINGENYNFKNVVRLRNLSIILHSEFLYLLGSSITKMETVEKKRNLYYLLVDFKNTWVDSYNNLNLDVLHYNAPPEHRPNLRDNHNQDLIENIRNANACLHSIIEYSQSVEEYFGKGYSITNEEIAVGEKGITKLKTKMDEYFALLEKVRKSLRSKRENGGKTIDEASTISQPIIDKYFGQGKIDNCKLDSETSSNEFEVLYSIPSEEVDTEPTENPFYCETDKGTFEKYGSVLSDLKDAIKPRKEEFDKRERDVIMKNPKYEKLLKFEEEEEAQKNGMSLSNSTSITGPSNEGEMQREDRFTEMVMPGPSNECDLQREDRFTEIAMSGPSNEGGMQSQYMLRLIASAAASKSYQWKHDDDDDNSEIIFE